MAIYSIFPQSYTGFTLKPGVNSCRIPRVPSGSRGHIIQVVFAHLLKSTYITSSFTLYMAQGWNSKTSLVYHNEPECLQLILITITWELWNADSFASQETLTPLARHGDLALVFLKSSPGDYRGSPAWEHCSNGKHFMTWSWLTSATGFSLEVGIQ